MTSPGPAAVRAASIVYGVLLTSLLAGGGVLVVLRQTGVMHTAIESAPTSVLRGTVLALVVAGAMILHGVRARISPPRSGEAPETWWVGEGRRAFVLWSVAEGVGLTGAVVYLVTGDLLTLVVPMVWGVLSLVINAPGRLTGM